MPPNVLHSLGQFAHLADAAGGKRRPRKVEACKAQAALAQQIDAAPDGLAGSPAEGQQQQCQGHGHADEVQGALPCLCGQFVKRQHLQQVQRGAQTDINLGVQTHPALSLDLHHLGCAKRLRGLEQLEQLGFVDGIEHGLRIATDTVQVNGCCHHLAAAVQQGEAGAWGRSQRQEQLLQIIESHVDADHRIGGCRLLAQRHAQPLGGGKPVGLRQLRDTRLLPCDGVPRPRARVILVICSVLHFLQIAGLVEKAVTTKASAIRLLCDRLDQKLGPLGRCHALPHNVQPQRAYQDEITIRVGDIHGGFQRVGAQFAQQGIQRLQTAGFIRRQGQSPCTDMAQCPLYRCQLQANLLT